MLQLWHSPGEGREGGSTFYHQYWERRFSLKSWILFHVVPFCSILINIEPNKIVLLSYQSTNQCCGIIDQFLKSKSNLDKEMLSRPVWGKVNVNQVCMSLCSSTKSAPGEQVGMNCNSMNQYFNILWKTINVASYIDFFYYQVTAGAPTLSSCIWWRDCRPPSTLTSDRCGSPLKVCCEA